MRKMRKSPVIPKVLLITVILLMSVLTGVTAQASGTKNKKALKAYRKMLARSEYAWSENPYSTYPNKTENYKFFTYDLNKDEVKELIVNAPGDRWSGGAVRVFTYLNGKVIDTKLPDVIDDIVIYKKSRLTAFLWASQGAVQVYHAKLSKKGVWVVKAYLSGVNPSLYHSDSYIRMGSSADLPFKIQNDVYDKLGFTKATAGNKTLSYKKYLSALKKLRKNNSKKVSIKWRKNTKANRKKYL